MNAFAADCLIYAAEPGHKLGERVYGLILDESARAVGSVLLLPEVLIKPVRANRENERLRLIDLLSRMELVTADQPIARLSVALGAKYGLRPVDSVHLATAVAVGADRFVTNNQRDFSTSIDEIEVVYPADLSGPSS